MTTSPEYQQARRNFFIMLLALAAAIFASMTVKGQTPDDWKKMKGEVNLFVANDLGRNGYYLQKDFAHLMGEMADVIGPEAIIAAGDIHHFNGIASTADPLWTSNYEQIYTHPELMIDWLPILGNHEYRGNTQAVIDYSKVSRRWVMNSRYYTKVFTDDDAGVSLRVIFIDTTPLIDSYRKESDKYPDACRQNVEEQLRWIDQTLSEAHEDWVVMVGHHPIYAQTSKGQHERDDMQRALLPLLKKYGNKVALYVCGHIHNFQHLRLPGDATDYVVNSSASLARKVSALPETIFCSPDEGFSVIAADKSLLRLLMVNKEGTAIHEVTKKKKQ